MNARKKLRLSLVGHLWSTAVFKAGGGFGSRWSSALLFTVKDGCRSESLQYRRHGYSASLNGGNVGMGYGLFKENREDQSSHIKKDVVRHIVKKSHTI